ncbi:MAG: sigma-70 family RNA polymerase sigma factor [Acidobacteria bacterium]|nr:sigma-70 family RNA polymerase sigma factor [Acidobacteriota bacterium]
MAFESIDNRSPAALDVPQLLAAWKHGDQAAGEELASVVQSELRRLARHYLSQKPGHTLQPTALVNEAYLRLIQKAQDVEWKDRSHLIAIAANYMREVLVDYARKNGSKRRGGDWLRATFEGVAEVEIRVDRDLIALDDALDAFSKDFPRQSRGVELRFFGGLSVEETARVLEVSADTVQRDWAFAKVWLLKELSPKASNPE